MLGKILLRIFAKSINIMKDSSLSHDMCYFSMYPSLSLNLPSLLLYVIISLTTSLNCSGVPVYRYKVPLVTQKMLTVSTSLATDSNMGGEDGFDEKGCHCEISVEDLLPSVKSVIRAVR